MIGRRVWAAFGVSVLLLAAGGTALAQTCPKPPLPALEGQWVLAVTWHPGFCETFGSGRPLPPECPEASKSDRLTLHGLWPQWREYCVEALPPGTLAEAPALAQKPCSVRWSRLPDLELSPSLQAKLDAVMPGVRSHLHRHEYVKHGTCSALPPEGYFDTAVTLVEALNATSLPRFLAENQGRAVTFRQMCDAVGAALGRSAAAAVEADSRRAKGPDGKQRYYLTELRFWLRPVDGRLSLAPENFMVVRAGTRTLGPKPADPLCDDHLDDRTLYIDRLGMGQ